jgi:hypothetical protein
LAFDWGSFIGGAILGGIAGGIFVGYQSLKIGVGLFEQASERGIINKEAIERAMRQQRARSSRARAYRVRAYSPTYRASAAKAIYGHGTGTESDLNRIPIFLS